MCSSEGEEVVLRNCHGVSYFGYVLVVAVVNLESLLGFGKTCVVLRLSRAGDREKNDSFLLKLQVGFSVRIGGTA